MNTTPLTTTEALYLGIKTAVKQEAERITAIEVEAAKVRIEKHLSEYSLVIVERACRYVSISHQQTSDKYASELVVRIRHDIKP